MKMKTMITICAAVMVCAAFVSPVQSKAQLSPNVSVYASGLAGPRGLRFGPDGELYVAEAGYGGTTMTTPGQCMQVPAPVGPYKNGDTSRISKIDHSGHRTTVASGFPSAVNALGDIQGVADVAFVDGQLYAITAGGGCSHGNTSIPNVLARVNTQNHSWSIVANMSAFVKSHPAMYPNAPDFEPDGVFYSLISYHDRFYTVEANHGQVFSVTRSGDASEEVDISRAESHIVPTAIAERDGKFYVGNLDTFPIVLRSSKILTLAHGGDDDDVPGLDRHGMDGLHVAGSRAGFATIVGVDFGPDGLLYILELSSAPGFPAPGMGKVVRLNRQGHIEDVATGLTVPTGMIFGPDGDLYVSNFGAAPPGAGQIVRISLP